jgi:hypothetical protein
LDHFACSQTPPQPFRAGIPIISGYFEEGQGLLGDRFSIVGLAMELDGVIFRAVGHFAVVLFCYTVHQFRNDFKVIASSDDSQMLHFDPSVSVSTVHASLSPSIYLKETLVFTSAMKPV